MAELRETVQQQTKTIKRFNRGQRSHTLMHTHTDMFPHMFIINTCILFVCVCVHMHIYILPVDSPPPPVSTMAAQEFDGMKEQLDLEQSLRVQAETFAHEVRNAVFLLAPVASQVDM